VHSDVLNISKLSAGFITLVTANFSPYEEAKNAVRMFRDEVSARRIVLGTSQWTRSTSGTCVATAAGSSRSS
jgi:hypothetical protein